MMHELKAKLQKVKDTKETILRWIDAEVCEGKECVASGIDGFGKLVDAAKDLAELEEKCVKTMYYEKIIEAMEKEKEEGERYGYDNWRYASGRFAPKGHGSYEGYEPMIGGRVHVHDPNMNIRDDFRMGYSNRGGSSGSGDQNDGRGRGTSGNSSNQGNDRYGYWYDEKIHSPRGAYYDDYQEAKRHYSETKRPEDMQQMNEKLGDNFSDLLMQVEEMAQDASPEMRKKLKMGVNSMMENLNRMA